MNQMRDRASTTVRRRPFALRGPAAGIVLVALAGLASQVARADEDTGDADLRMIEQRLRADDLKGAWQILDEREKRESSRRLPGQYAAAQAREFVVGVYISQRAELVR